MDTLGGGGEDDYLSTYCHIIHTPVAVVQVNWYNTRRYACAYQRTRERVMWRVFGRRRDEFYREQLSSSCHTGWYKILHD